MSSSSKSKSSTSNTTTTTDARVAADNGAIVVSDGDAHFTDGGAFIFAQNVLSEVIDASTGLAKVSEQIAFDSIGFVDQANRQQGDLLSQVADQQRSELSQLAEQLVKFGLPLAAVVAAIYFWRLSE